MIMLAIKIGNAYKFRQYCMRKLNTKLIMSAARHAQIDGRVERDNKTTQLSLLRCYNGSVCDWVSHLPIWLIFY